MQLLSQFVLIFSHYNPIWYLHYFRVNFHTGGLLGEYEVEGCNGTSPTLVLERDKTYTMVQVLTRNTKKNHDISFSSNQCNFRKTSPTGCTRWALPTILTARTGSSNMQRSLLLSSNWIQKRLRCLLHIYINMFLLQVPELEEPHPETCSEQQFLCNPNNQSSKGQAMKASS